MSTKEFTVDEKLTAVCNWADDKQHFDPSFINSLTKNFEQWGSLTERQLEALDNTIDSCHIDISEHL